MKRLLEWWLRWYPTHEATQYSLVPFTVRKNPIKEVQFGRFTIIYYVKRTWYMRFVQSDILKVYIYHESIEPKGDVLSNSRNIHKHEYTGIDRNFVLWVLDEFVYRLYHAIYVW